MSYAFGRAFQQLDEECLAAAACMQDQQSGSTAVVGLQVWCILPLHLCVDKMTIVPWRHEIALAPLAADHHTVQPPLQVGLKLYVANVGDSRAVLCRAGHAVPLTVPHKPHMPAERARIQAAGGTLIKVCACFTRTSLSCLKIDDLRQLLHHPRTLSIQANAYVA